MTTIKKINRNQLKKYTEAEIAMPLIVFKAIRIKMYLYFTYKTMAIL